MKIVIFRKKILVVLSVMVLIAFGANNIFAEEESTSTNQQDTEFKAGMVKLESILELHPDTQDLYTEYQNELSQLNTTTSDEGDDKETTVKKLKQKYISLLRNKIQGDLDQFTNSLDLDVLLIDNTIVNGNPDINPDNLSNITDLTQYLETYLSELNSTTTNSTEE